ncbi:MAG: Sua5/YciO/YrdC/YwlC family protein [Rhodospirillales bacterium]|nr:Sua5/YciO/YrdC/YwlC family protein [Rhodospirillales bacterium]MDE2574579.1 Sua5/YciO/YrdC/YwlC family protein [Rhodospirillales bacterium]
MSDIAAPAAPERVAADAGIVLDAMQAGGVAILPLDVAYAVIGTTEAAIRRIFAVKARSYEKPSGMFATWEMSRELHVMPPERHAIARVIVEEYGLPFSIVAPFHAGHDMLRGVDPFVLASSTKAGTLDMLINAGPWHNAVARLALARGVCVFGSSANRSLTGSKYRLTDIEPELRAAAAVGIDGGTAKYANAAGLSSTIIDFRDFRFIRRGVCCEQLTTIFCDRFDITLRD